MNIEQYIDRGRCPKCGGVTDYDKYEPPKNGRPPHKNCSCYSYDVNDDNQDFINKLISDL
jgi:hypothetical protein